MILNFQVFILYLVIVASQIDEKEGVWVLNDNNFEHALKLQPEILVEFYAP